MRIGAPIAQDGAVPKEVDGFLDALRDNAMLKRRFSARGSGRHQVVSAVHRFAADGLFHRRLLAEADRSRGGQRSATTKRRSLAKHGKQLATEKRQALHVRPDRPPAPPGAVARVHYRRRAADWIWRRIHAARRTDSGNNAAAVERGTAAGVGSRHRIPACAAEAVSRSTAQAARSQRMGRVRAGSGARLAAEAGVVGGKNPARRRAV